MRSARKSVWGFLRRTAVAATVTAAAAAGLAAPAAEAAGTTTAGTTTAPTTTAGSADVLLPRPWRASLGAATAGGTVTFRQDPLGVMGHWTVKGVLDAPAGDCYFVRITAAASWDSPLTCGPRVSDPFVVTINQPVFSPGGTARVCAARPGPDLCGTPVRLW